MPVGINKTNAGIGGQIPQHNLTGYTQLREKRLYKSLRDVALLTDMNMRGGFGQLERGTVLAEDSNTGFMVPYVADDPTDTASPGAVFLVANGANASDELRISLEESYKFAAGDDIAINSGGAAMLARTIDDIDRTGQVAIITLTVALNDDYTTADNAYIFLQCGAVGEDYSEAVCILDSDIYTGVDEGSGGALAPVLLSNAVIYQDAVIGMDAGAQTDLGNVSEFGTIYYVLR